MIERVRLITENEQRRSPIPGLSPLLPGASDLTPPVAKDEEGLRAFVRFCEEKVFYETKMSSAANEMLGIFQDLRKSGESRRQLQSETSSVSGGAGGADSSADDEEEEQDPTKSPRKSTATAGRRRATPVEPAVRYIVYKPMLAGEYHRTYRFFVAICSQAVDVPETELHLAVRSLEIRLVPRDAQLRRVSAQRSAAQKTQKVRASESGGGGCKSGRLGCCGGAQSCPSRRTPPASSNQV